MQRYGQIYEEVKALRKETRHSVRDLRERFKEKGVIQNKDQFIVKLIAQVRFLLSSPPPPTPPDRSGRLAWRSEGCACVRNRTYGT